jgi:hypothetical protein
MAIVDKLLFGAVVMTVPASQEAMIWINVGQPSASRCARRAIYRNL